MLTRTKIICTIGPSCNTLEKIIALCNEGMNVARLNLSHGTQEDHAIIIERLKEAREILKQPLAIMLDTKGPEIRIGKVENGEIFLEQGQRLLLTQEEIVGNSEKIQILPGFILEHIPKGATILFDDGYITSRAVAGGTKEGLVVELINSGKLKSGKGVNVPGVDIPLPAVTEQDISDIIFGCKHDVDIIAASFVRSVDHLITIKNILAAEKKKDILLIAKIENSEGVRNFDAIVQVADGIMIARGDLGVEVPLSEVPKLQKMMIRKSYIAGKPAITATQMLESMINNPRPTRAEVSDVANAIYDSTSAVMLSGETAIGMFPLEAVKTMRTIVQETERDFNYLDFFQAFSRFIYHDVPSAVTLATVKTGYSSNAKAIFAFTKNGGTARLLSRFRPQMPIVAMTPNPKCYHQLALNWGVIPHHQEEGIESVVGAFEKICTFALAENIVAYGDLAIVTAGSPFGISGTTNMMIVESIGNVLVRGAHGVGESVYGNVALLLTPETTPAYTMRGQIIVITKYNESYLAFIKEAAGVILQNQVNDKESENLLLEAAKMLNIPALVRADAAFQILKEKQLITLDPQKALVYKSIPKN